MTKLKNYISINLLSLIGNIFLLIFSLLIFVLLPLSLYLESAYYAENYYPLYSFINILGFIFMFFSLLELVIIPGVIVEILFYKFTKLKPLHILRKYPNKLFISGLLMTPLPFAIYILGYLGY